MVWILILVLNHPILVKPPLFDMFAYPQVFTTHEECSKQLMIESIKPSISIAYCQSIPIGSYAK